jgi:hypothetical protein
MKKVNFNALDLDPETIGNLTEEQAEEIQGGYTDSCNKGSCNTKAAAVAE